MARKKKPVGEKKSEAMRFFSKPDGSLTSDFDVYVEAWRELGSVITKITGWRLLSFDPDLGFYRDKEGFTEHVATDFAMAIKDALEGRPVQVVGGKLFRFKANGHDIMDPDRTVDIEGWVAADDEQEAVRKVISKYDLGMLAGVSIMGREIEGEAVISLAKYSDTGEPMAPRRIPKPFKLVDERSGE